MAVPGPDCRFGTDECSTVNVAVMYPDPEPCVPVVDDSALTCVGSDWLARLDMLHVMFHCETKEVVH